MWLRRLAVSLADSYVALLEEYRSITHDPREYFSQLLEVPIFNMPQIELGTTAIFVTLEAFDYGRVANHQLLATEGVSYGTTLFTDKLPESLRGKITLINQGDGQTITQRSDYHLWITRRHEELHSHFDIIRKLQRRSAFVCFKDEFNNINDPLSYDAHERLASRAHKYIFDVARSELISYYSTYFESDIWDSSAFFTNREWLGKGLDEFLERHAITGEAADEIKDIYQRSWGDFKDKYIQYKSLIRDLYLGSESVSRRNEIDALLMLIPIESLETLKEFIERPKIQPNSELPLVKIG